MEELLRGLGRFVGILVGTKKVIEGSIRDILLAIAKNVGGDVLLRAIYTFPQPDNNILKEVFSLGLDNSTLHKLCGNQVNIDCLFNIVESLQNRRPSIDRQQIDRQQNGS